MQDIFARRHIRCGRYQHVYSTSSHPLHFYNSCYSGLNRRPSSLPIMPYLPELGDKVTGNSCAGAGEERAGSREEHATPCINSRLRVLVRSAQAMSSSLFPPFPSCHLNVSCSHINVVIFIRSSKSVESTTPTSQKLPFALFVND